MVFTDGLCLEPGWGGLFVLVFFTGSTTQQMQQTLRDTQPILRHCHLLAKHFWDCFSHPSLLYPPSPLEMQEMIRKPLDGDKAFDLL